MASSVGYLCLCLLLVLRRSRRRRSNQRFSWKPCLFSSFVSRLFVSHRRYLSWRLGRQTNKEKRLILVPVRTTTCGRYDRLDGQPRERSRGKRACLVSLETGRFLGSVWAGRRSLGTLGCGSLFFASQDCSVSNFRLSGILSAGVLGRQ